MNETAGDELMDRHRSNWSRAVIRFERALGACTNVQDEQRLCEKIGYALAYGSRPELATPWYERSAKQHISRDRQRWFESRTQDALLEFDHMYEMLDLSHKYKPDFRNTIILQHARLYVLLGKYDEGERLHRSVESFAEKKGDDFTPVYRWIFHAARGHKKQAFDRFDRGPESASLLRGSGLAPGTWDEYANWAIELGRLDIAQVCRERSLFVARERRLGWHIPYCNLRLAELLLLSGNYNDARHFLTEAMLYETESPFLHVMLGTIGVELAHTIGDEILLKRVFDEAVVDDALASGEPRRIAKGITAYAKVAIARRQLGRVRQLITRGMAAINDAAQTGELLAMAGRYGTPSDAIRARTLLEERSRLFQDRATQGYLDLWHAQSELARRAAPVAKGYVEKAAQSFVQLGWKHQERESLSLVGIVRKKFGSEAHTKGAILGNLHPALTEREQQIAELALRGLKNRAIAELLSISEHTVESHMRSILNRFGLRSRWQLLQFTS